MEQVAVAAPSPVSFQHVEEGVAVAPEIPIDSTTLILDYNSSDKTYKVSDTLWLSARKLPHDKSILAKARRLAKKRPRVEQVVDEMATPYSPGSIVYCKGFAGGGEQWFKSMVVSYRKKFPPNVIKYLSTLDGQTSKLALPNVTTAYLPAIHIRPTPPLEKKRRRQTAST